MSTSGGSRISIGRAFETRGEHATQEEVIVRVDHHLVLILQ